MPKTGHGERLAVGHARGAGGRQGSQMISRASAWALASLVSGNGRFNGLPHLGH